MQGFCARWAAVGLVLGGCGAPLAPAAIPDPLASAEPAASSPPLVASAASDPPPPGPGTPPRVRFVVERGGDGEGKAFVVVSELGVKHPIGGVPASHRCALSGGGSQVGLALGPTVSFECWQAAAAFVSVAEKRLEIRPEHGKKLQLDLPLPAEIVPGVSDPAVVPACPEGAKASTIEVRATDERRDGLRALRLAIPFFQVDRSFPMPAHPYCHSRPQGSHRLDLSCAGDSSIAMVSLWLREGIVWMKEFEGNYEPGSTVERGGMVLPCGASLRFPRLHLVDPSAAPPGSTPACQTAADRCEDRCADARGDHEDEPAAQAEQQCKAPCQQQRKACAARKQASGSPPSRAP